jgi:hypothetical protein
MSEVRIPGGDDLAAGGDNWRWAVVIGGDGDGGG